MDKSTLKKISWQQKWGKIQAKHVKLLVLIAALFYAIYNTFDGYLMQKQLPDTSDPYIKILAYLTLGGIYGTLLQGLLSFTPLGTVVDSNHKKDSMKELLTLGNIVTGAVAGLLAASATALYLWGNLNYDPAIMTALAGCTVFFVILIEVLFEHANFKTMLKPAGFVFAGTFLIVIVGMDKESIRLKDIVLVIVVILFARNLLSAIEEVLSKKGVLKTNATSFSVLRFFWLAVFGVLGALFYTLATDQFGEYLQTLAKAITNIKTMLYITLTMTLVFLGQGWKQYAKKSEGVSVSMVIMLFSVSVFFGLIATVIANELVTGGYKTVPMSTLSWIARIVGTLVLFQGINLATKIHYK